MGKTYGEYKWPVTPYFMASFPVTQAHVLIHKHTAGTCTREKNMLNIFTTYSVVNMTHYYSAQTSDDTNTVHMQK